jgi:PPOX class probable F420-dependent enzyme
MPVDSIAARRLNRFLTTEPVVWISSVRPDGTPHLVPIWFTWDGEALLVFSKPHAQKVRNLRSNPTVMLALGDPTADFDVALVEARAELDSRPARELPATHLAKYGDRMAALGLSPATFLSTYSQVIRFTPVRPLGWHGRTTPPSVTALASIDEPVRPVARRFVGEPLAAAVGPPPAPVERRVRAGFGRALASLFGQDRPRPLAAPA